MTQPTNPSTGTLAVHADPDQGQIPFRLRIGVTGDPDLPHDPALATAVSNQLSQLIELIQDEEPTVLARLASPLRDRESSLVELTVISRLASGADRLIVREILAFATQQNQRARLQVVTPAHRTAHAHVERWDTAARTGLSQYLDRLSIVTESGRADHAPGSSDYARAEREHADEEATSRFLASCDVLFVLWDGLKADGPGRTAETLLAAASLRKPCVWISTGPDHPVMTNFGSGHSYGFYLDVSERAGLPDSPSHPPLPPPEPRKPDQDVLSPLRESLRLLGRYNGQQLGAKFGRRLNDEFDDPHGADRWIAPYFLRADILAGKHQTRFTWSARALTILAIAAAAVLGVHLTLNSSPIWDWAEVGSLAAITLIFLALHFLEFHDRWISYRVLAERLRSAQFLVSAGFDFPVFHRVVTAYIERHPSDWIQRTFDEFWQSERERRKDDQSGHHEVAAKRTARPDKDKEKKLADGLADGWIGGQIAYHRKRQVEHQLWQRILLVSISISFAAAVLCAILDAMAVDRDLNGFLSVLLPAAAASLGALLTVRQHRQLAERSGQVSKDLEEAQWQIRHAKYRPMIVSAAAKAARIMAEENEDWLGALWFLDVEHPG